jgi:hypothetical protein
MQKGALLAVVQLLIVGTLAGKLLADRARYPRVWVKTAPYDPDLPIRGRYVRLRLEVKAEPAFVPSEEQTPGETKLFRYFPNADLQVRNGELIAVPNEQGATGVQVMSGQGDHALLNEAVAFFIPEHVEDPSIRPRGEELWVEVTVPRAGPPRPIRLGVKKGGATILPL